MSRCQWIPQHVHKVFARLGTRHSRTRTNHSSIVIKRRWWSFAKSRPSNSRWMNSVRTSVGSPGKVFRVHSHRLLAVQQPGHERSASKKPKVKTCAHAQGMESEQSFAPCPKNISNKLKRSEKPSIKVSQMDMDRSSA